MSVDVEQLDQLRHLTQRLWDATDALDLVRHRDPVNLAAERDALRAAVAAGERLWSPVLAYAPFPAGAEQQVEEVLGAAHELGPLLDPLWRETTVALRLELAAIRRRTPAAWLEHGRHAYGEPSDELVATARRVLAAPRRPTDDTPCPVDELVGAMERGLAALPAPGWRVEVHPGMAARVSVSAARRAVRVGADAVVGRGAVHGLVLHEVGVHVVRAINGAAQPLLMLARGLPGYLEAEEGLATWHERTFAGGAARERTFALRVLAGARALESSFARVLEELLDLGAAPGLAIAIAVRAKRGLVDTAVPGSSLKDVVYLRGLVRAGALVEQDPSALDLLLRGKSGFHHLPLLAALRDGGHLAPAVVGPQPLH